MLATSILISWLYIQNFPLSFALPISKQGLLEVNYTVGLKFDPVGNYDHLKIMALL